MPIPLGYKDDKASDYAILPPREHACKLVSVELTTGMNFAKTQEVQQIKWGWESLKYRSEDGKPGIISLWTGMNYGPSKAHLTTLLDQIFGRSLTQAEAARIDPEMLIGLKGHVMVLPHKKGDGTMTSKFGGFRLPDGQTPPSPADFFMSSVPTPARQAADAKDVDFDEDLSDTEDPFAE